MYVVEHTLAWYIATLIKSRDPNSYKIQCFVDLKPHSDRILQIPLCQKQINQKSLVGVYLELVLMLYPQSSLQLQSVAELEFKEEKSNYLLSYCFI